MSISEQAPIRVLAADISPMNTQLLLEALRQDSRLQVSASPDGAKDFASCLALLDPQVAVIGIRANGSARADFELVRRSLLRSPQLQVIVLLDRPSNDLVVESFRAGARGIVCRDQALDALRNGVLAVHRGEIWATHAQLRLLLEVFSRRWVPGAVVDSRGQALLSRRELDVVRCVAEGMTNRDIALHLSLSEHTVKNYLFRAFEKLGVSNRAELILYAVNHSWTPNQNELMPYPASPRQMGGHSKRGNSRCSASGSISSETPAIPQLRGLR